MAYQVRLTQFEGPLDLLLHLIEQAELDIKDIFVSEITAQYMACMGEVGELDMDTASEFLTMAATLLYIKSRQLLPRPPKEEIEEEDPEVVLIRQLREYKAFKEASTELQKLFDESKGGFARLPEDVVLPPKEISLDNTTLASLLDAFSAMLARNEANRPEEAKRALHHVRADTYTVREQIGRIRNLLSEQKSLSFEELFSPQAPRMEMIVTFMALLEMIAHGEIMLQQREPFASIQISAGTLRADDQDAQYMDEEDIIHE